MTIAYLAIDESFTVVAKSDVPEQSILGVIEGCGLGLRARPATGFPLAFRFDKDDLVIGAIEMMPLVGGLSVTVRGVVQINVKPHYLSVFLDSTVVWEFYDLAGPVLGDVAIEGLSVSDESSDEPIFVVSAQGARTVSEARNFLGSALETPSGDDSVAPVRLSNYVNLRFGSVSKKTGGDFIDNITPDKNLYLATANTQSQTYLCVFHDGTFAAFSEGAIDDVLGWLNGSASQLGKSDFGLLTQAYDHYFSMLGTSDETESWTARESQNVNRFAPCHFVLASITGDTQADIDLVTGELSHYEDTLRDMSELYGRIDEDDVMVIGISKR